MGDIIYSSTLSGDVQLCTQVYRRRRRRRSSRRRVLLRRVFPAALRRSVFRPPARLQAAEGGGLQAAGHQR